MTLHEITQLAKAGFTKAEIFQLAGLTQQAPQQAPQQVPQQMPQQMPQQVPQQMPQQVPQQMPQQMPQQAPAPVYNQNVMAGLLKSYDLGGVAQPQYGQQGSGQTGQGVPYVPQLPETVVSQQAADANMQAILAMSKPYQPATAETALEKLINGVKEDK